MSKIAFIVVLYNTRWKDSIAAQSLESAGISLSNVFVYDNSNDGHIQKSNEDFRLANYFSLGENRGLSFAYNYLVNEIGNVPDTQYDYVVFMDSDTVFSNTYFDALRDVNQQKTDVFLPIVEDVSKPGTIVSPNQKGVLKNKFSSENELPNLTKINAINSGMVVSKLVLNQIKFDETLFLDEVDSAFFDELRRARVTIGLLRVKIQQNFSASSISNSDGSRFRFRLRVRDLLIYYSHQKWFVRPFGMVKVLLLGLRNGLHARSLRFFGIAVSEIFNYFWR